MNKKFVILADVTCDISKEFRKEYDIELIPGHFTTPDGKEHLGDCTWDELQLIHDKMETELGKEGAFLDAIYVCPHHPDKGFEDERPEYKFDCECRKPKPGLLLQAARDFNINLSQSYMVGDSERDTSAGEVCGIKKSILIETNEAFGLSQIIEKMDLK